MKIGISFLILFLFSFAHANQYELNGFTVTKPKNYHQNYFGYDTRTQCTAGLGNFCLPQGTEVMCGKYSYVRKSPDLIIQFCHMGQIKNKDGVLPIPIENNYTVATGFITKKGYHQGVPANDVFNMKMKDAELVNVADVPFVPRPVTQVPKSEDTEGGITQCLNNAGNCVDRLGEFIKNLNPNVNPNVVTAVSVSQSEIAQLVTSRKNPLPVKPLCDSFIEDSGKLGPYGKQTIAALNKVGWGCFSGEGRPTIDVSAACPNFKKFDRATKEYFWAWVFMSIANKESSCNPGARNPNGTNDIADGLMQMEFSAQQRKDAGRNSKYCPYMGVNSQDLRFQFECSASILTDINCKKGLPLTSKSGYWHAMLGTSPLISRNIMKFPKCFGN